MSGRDETRYRRTSLPPPGGMSGEVIVMKKVLWLGALLTVGTLIGGYFGMRDSTTASQPFGRSRSGAICPVPPCTTTVTVD